MAKQVTFTRFLDIKNPALRAWNQLHFNMNLLETHGQEVSEKYFEMLTQAERMNMLLVGARIAVKGVEFVKKEVMEHSDNS
jgi:hypothetical protein